MGGIDKFDQRLQYYSYPHKFMKWWKFIFIYLLEVAIFNSFVIYCEVLRISGRKNVSYLDYRLELVGSLTEFELGESKVEKMEKKDRNSSGEIKEHRKILSDKKRRCAYCMSKGIRSNCTTICDVCNIYLHKKCFSKHLNN